METLKITKADLNDPHEWRSGRSVDSGEAMKRQRPVDGGMSWCDDLHAFECYGCMEMIEIRRIVYGSPERLAEFREILVLEHTECWMFNDAEMAQNARKYRKEKKRRELIQGPRYGFTGR